MPTLLETLQQRLGKAPAPAATPDLNISEVVAAKKGKAGGSGRGIAASTVGQGIATDIGQQQVSQAVLGGQIQGAQLAEQSQGLAQQQQLAGEQLQSQQKQFDANQAAQLLGKRAEMAGNEQLAAQQRAGQEGLKTADLNNRATMALSELASNSQISRDDLFAGFKNENKILADRQDAAELEQRGVLLAMQDQSYVDELNRIGKIRKLDTDLGFQAEAREVIYGQELAKLLDDLGFKAGQNAKLRDVNKQLAELSNAQVIQLATMAADAANSRAAWESVGTATSQVVDYAAKNAKKG